MVQLFVSTGFCHFDYCQADRADRSFVSPIDRIGLPVKKIPYISQQAAIAGFTSPLINSLVSLVADVSVFLMIFGILFYRDNKQRLVNEQTQKGYYITTKWSGSDLIKVLELAKHNELERLLWKIDTLDMSENEKWKSTNHILKLNRMIDEFEGSPQKRGETANMIQETGWYDNTGNSYSTFPEPYTNSYSIQLSYSDWPQQ